MRARQSIQIPSVTELIAHGRTTLDIYERGTIKLLNERFGGNVAPLLLLTEQSLHDIKGFGGYKRIPLLKERLETHGLRLRDFHEHTIDRAIALYGSLENMPLQALYVQYAQAGIVTFTHYYESPAVSTMVRLARAATDDLEYSSGPEMTLGELVAMSRAQLLQYFDLHGIALDSSRAKLMADEIESRLSGWQLCLCKQSARVTVS